MRRCNSAAVILSPSQSLRGAKTDETTGTETQALQLALQEGLAHMQPLHHLPLNPDASTEALPAGLLL
jgi:hypothetical protein